jgi:cytochrome c553
MVTMKKTYLLAVALIASAISLNAFAGGDIVAGKALADKTCAACHGVDLKSPIDPTYPKLAGQHREYLEHALTAYQRGGDGPNGRNSAIMGPQAKLLSKLDIKNVAAYLASLPGPLVVEK